MCVLQLRPYPLTDQDQDQDHNDMLADEAYHTPQKQWQTIQERWEKNNYVLRTYPIARLLTRDPT